MTTAASLPKGVRVFGYVALTFLVLIALAAAFVASRPAAFRIERSADISAPADVVFPIINDLHRWPQWSPFEKLDPDMKKTYEGPESGVGAVSAWNGNSQAGEGRMTIVESKPGELVAMNLEFTRPFACNNLVKFKLVPDGDKTRVSWIMEGNNNFMGKAFSAIMDMDQMVGKDFEEGLANLDRVAQAEMKQGKDAAP